MTGRDQAAQGAGRHLLAATDDGVVRDGAGIEWRRLEEAPQRRLEARGIGQGLAGCRRFGRFQAQIAGDGDSGERALGERGMGAAEAGAVADGEDLAQAGAAVTVGQGFHRAAATWHEAVRAAQRTRQFRRRREAVVEGDDVDVEDKVARDDAVDAIIAEELRHLAIPMQTFPEPRRQRDALEQQEGIGRCR